MAKLIIAAAKAAKGRLIQFRLQEHRFGFSWILNGLQAFFSFKWL
jgi:hypothetical protein